MNKWISGEWVVDRTNAKQHYWLTIFWVYERPPATGCEGPDAS
jgi:hypothetical protein